MDESRGWVGWLGTFVERCFSAGDSGSIGGIGRRSFTVSIGGIGRRSFTVSPGGVGIIGGIGSRAGRLVGEVSLWTFGVTLLGSQVALFAASASLPSYDPLPAIYIQLRCHCCLL